MQAQKALNRSNRVMGGSIMVGVSPCTDTAIMEQDAANASCLNASVNQSHVAAAETSIMTLNSSIGGSQLNRSIRPMTQAYKTAQSENQVRSPFLMYFKFNYQCLSLQITSATNTPNKSSGIVGKAMEYIFGW